MSKVASTARITFTDITKGVDHESGLEDQARVTWEAVRRLADVSRWNRQLHNNTVGYAGHLVMKGLIRQLFPRASENQITRFSGMIGQVLRKTHTCVCLKRGHKGEPSIWWVSHTMPNDFITVAVNIHRRDQQGLGGTGAIDPTWTESHLTPEEAGEDRQPAPVEIVHGEPKQKDEAMPTNWPTPQAEEAFKKSHADRILEYQQLKAHLLVWMKQFDQPLGVSEIAGAWQKREQTTVRRMLGELVKSGDLFERIETFEERALRAGGSPGFARRGTIYSHINPVPDRTIAAVVTDGPPLQSVKQILAGKRTTRDAAASKIIDVLLEANRGLYVGGGEGLVKKTGLSRDVVLKTLEWMKNQNLVFKASKHAWMLEDWRHRLRTNGHTHPAPTPEVEPQPEPQAAPPSEPTGPAGEPLVTGPVNGGTLDPRIEEIISLVVDIAQDNQPTVDPSVVEHLNEENGRLRNELAKSQDETARLHKAVDGLKAALAALQTS